MANFSKSDKEVIVLGFGMFVLSLFMMAFCFLSLVFDQLKLQIPFIAVLVSIYNVGAMVRSYCIRKS